MVFHMGQNRKGRYYPPSEIGREDGESEVTITPPQTMHQRLTELNKKITEKAPGYFVRVNEFGKFVWSLVGPDGNVCFTRESFERIEAVTENWLRAKH